VNQRRLVRGDVSEELAMSTFRTLISELKGVTYQGNVIINVINHTLLFRLVSRVKQIFKEFYTSDSSKLDAKPHRVKVFVEDDTVISRKKNFESLLFLYINPYQPPPPPKPTGGSYGAQTVAYLYKSLQFYYWSFTLLCEHISYFSTIIRTFIVSNNVFNLLLFYSPSLSGFIFLFLSDFK
jgi:hypothetical protein